MFTWYNIIINIIRGSGKMYGGKANSLIKLQENGLNVPKFFIIDINDYKEFLEENNLLSKIKEFLKEEKRDLIKEAILNGKIGNTLESKIKEKFKNLNSDFVSVRSSALNEDGKDKAFAGQYDSYLNVDDNNLLEKIKLCWISFYNSNVQEYYKNDDIFGMNVIVQSMINPDYAGVAFSTDPTSSTNNYSVIEVVKGLGEGLVSGKITPTKFIIRKITNHIDLKIGDLVINNAIIQKLEELVLKIEKLYECPMDIEYAIKNGTIYILQARPITTNNLSIKSFSLILKRPMSVIEMELYFKGEYEGIKKLTRELYYFKPLFTYNSDHNNVEIYYNEIDLEEDPRLIYYYMDMDFDKIKEYFNDIIMKDIRYLENTMLNKIEFNIIELKNRIINIYPFISLGQLAGHFEPISQRLKEFLINFRNKYDYIIHDIGDFINEKILEKLPIEYKDYVDFITLDEYTNELPNLSTLQSRKKGYIYFGNLYTTQDYKKWFTENDISIMEDTNISLTGDVAYKKDIIGKVCIIYNENDFDKFESKDILVTPMTIPKFMKIIKMASGIITDEGGITCHASIIARELKIPCVVGCKNATKVLRDGDLIKIDGATGNIIKLSN